VVKLKGVRVIADESGAPTHQTHLEATFNIQDCNRKTTLEQDLVLTKNHEGWTASMVMDGFPPQESTELAVLKLADWFTRMGNAITQDKEKFGVINLNEIQRGGKL